MLNTLISSSPELQPLAEGTIADPYGQIYNINPVTGGIGETYLGKQQPMSYEQQLQNTQKGLPTSSTLVGQQLNIGWDANNPTQTISSVSKEANNPGFVITTNTGDKYNYFDNNYLMNGMISGNTQTISPKFVDYYNQGQVIPLKLNKYSDAPSISDNTFGQGYIVPYSTGKDFYNTVDLTKGFTPLQVNWTGQNVDGWGYQGAKSSQPDASISGANSTVAGINPDGSISLNPYTHPRYSSEERGGIMGFIDNNGWVVPLALITAGAASGLAGGAAAAEGVGAAGAAEGVGAGAGAAGFDSTAAALGGSGGGGAFVPAAGSGASFTLTPGAVYTAGVSGGAGGSGLAGPTYQELGYTGLEAGQAGPTYGELGYTGLNNQEAIAAADAASKGMSASDILSNANRVRNLANALKGTLSPASSTGKSLSIPSSLSSSLSSLAQGSNPQAQNLVNLVRGNVNPFMQAPQQPIQNTKPDLTSLAQLLKQG